MEDELLLRIYRDCLARLNGRRWDELGRFVADGVVYNGEQLGRIGYRTMLEADTHAVPDFQFIPKILLADDHVVSCRLFFEWTPRHEFLGFAPTGRRVSFPEHVFYRFEDRRIVEVWSVIDKDAVRQQLSQA